MKRSQRVYLQDILKRIGRIERLVAKGLAVIEADEDLQDALERNFEVIGEAVKHLSPAVKHMWPDVPWKDIAGFRDVLIHGYDEIRLEITWETAQLDVPVLKTAVLALLASLPDDADPG